VATSARARCQQQVDLTVVPAGGQSAVPAGPDGVHHRVQRPASTLLDQQLIGGDALLRAHRHRDVRQRGPQAERVGTGGGLALIPDPAAQQFVDEAALRTHLE
jgi:hypothetical protein